jgi:hypothetical protein
MGGGLRTFLHDQLKRTVVSVATSAQAAPQVEARPFGSAPELRVDVLLRGLLVAGRAVAVDLAVTHALRQDVVALAAATGGAAASQYEAVKTAKYGAAAARDGFTFIPLVVDTFGAWGRSGLPVLDALSRRACVRWGVSAGKARYIVLGKLNRILMHGVASLLLANAVVARDLAAPATLAV